MRVLKITMIALMFSGIFMACSKDNDGNSNPVSIEGRWVGKYGNGSANPSIYYSLNFKSGGIIEEYNSSDQKLGEGTWEMTGNTITAHYNWLPPNSSSYTIVAAFNSSQGKLLGNWGYGNNATNGGLFEMTKQ